MALNDGTQPVSDSLGDVFGGGVAISAGASDNRIGTDGASIDDVGERNVIAGSNNDGIDIYGTGTDANAVAGNFIGTDVTGTRSLGISGDGVFLAEGASFNWIGVNPTGGTIVGDEGNVISGNGNVGVQIDGPSTDNVVAGNKIGTDAAGAVALGNFQLGVQLDSSSGNTIGGTVAGAVNVISGNGVFGVDLYGGFDNVVEGDLIGTDETGTRGLGNGVDGVIVHAGATSNIIGGTVRAARNVISSNAGWGVELDGGSDTLVEGNFIGTDVTGTKPLGNILGGVEIDANGNGPSTDNTIGGSTAGAGNVISANEGFGLVITGTGVTGNVVQGNSIGTDLTGNVALGNRQGGGQIANGNMIGGLTTPGGDFYGFDFASTTTPLNLTFRGELAGPPQQPTSGGAIAVYHIDVEADVGLLAIVDAGGLTARLMLLDSHGQVLIQSDRLSPTDPYPAIDQHLSAGSYSLVVESTGGVGTYNLTTSLTPSVAPLQAIPIGLSVNGIMAGDFNGDGRIDLAVTGIVDVSSFNQGAGEVSVLLANDDGTFRPAVTYAVGSEAGAIVSGDFNGDGKLDLAVTGRGYDFHTGTTTDAAVLSVLLGNGDGTFQPAAEFAVSGPSNVFPLGAITTGDFNRDGDLDLAMAGTYYTYNNNSTEIVSGEVLVLFGNGDGTFRNRGSIPRGFSAGCDRSRRF